jgi:hypothetical protein
MVNAHKTNVPYHQTPRERTALPCLQSFGRSKPLQNLWLYAMEINIQKGRHKMTNLELLDGLNNLSFKLLNEMRFEERTFVEEAIELLLPKKQEAPDYAQMILDSAKQAADLHKMGLI